MARLNNILHVGVSRPTIYKCIDKALAAGARAGLKDRYHRAREPEILPDAKAWAVNVAYQQPKTLGVAAELWTLTALTRYVRGAADAAGHPRLARISRTSVWKLLQEEELKPHRVRCYLERRDPDFDRKMRDVLMFYREVYLASPDQTDTPRPMFTVSVDEKPGVQAIGNTAPDLSPVPGERPALSRDHEYVRHGTVSTLAALDLHTRHLLANVESRHRSREFVALLERLDEYYPPDAVIRLILDNHSAHISRETRAYLATRPGRFEYVHTPKHGSWLNLIECAFVNRKLDFSRDTPHDSTHPYTRSDHSSSPTHQPPTTTPTHDRRSRALASPPPGTAPPRDTRDKGRKYDRL